MAVASDGSVPCNVVLLNQTPFVLLPLRSQVVMLVHAIVLVLSLPFSITLPPLHHLRALKVYYALVVCISKSHDI